MPLTSASDLPNHISMSAPYYDKGLPEMIRNVEEDVHKQEETLWKLKALWTQLRGDTTWAPVENFHDHFDDCLLQDSGSSLLTSSVLNGEADRFRELKESADLTQKQRSATSLDTSVQGDNLATAVMDGRAIPSNGHSAAKEAVAADLPATTLGLEYPPQRDMTSVNGDTDMANAVEERRVSGGATPDANTTAIDFGLAGNQPHDSTREAASQSGEDNDSRHQSHRMTTRAQAHRGSHSPSRHRSDSEPSSVPAIHPIFQFPVTAICDETAGLPTHVADESRACLLQYVSKQEEVLRQQRRLLENLRKALDMRRNVLRWCKAEAHVGEMSDGEDWYDKEEWNLDADLVKGREEEDDDDRGGKTRRRARGERAN